MSTEARRAPFAWPLLGGLLVAAVSTLSGCGPYLYSTPVSTVAFASTTRCAQGPFELHGRTLGSRWGEQLEVYATGAPLEGHITIEVDGQKQVDTTFQTKGTITYGGSTPTSTTYVMKPNQNACLLSDKDRDRATAVSTTPMPGPRGPVLPNGGPPAPGGEVPHLQMVPVDRGQATPYTGMATWTFQVTSLAIEPKRAGADIKIVFWSDSPLDLQGVKFFIRQSMEVASDEAEWTKKLTAEASAQARVVAEAKAKEQARQDRWQACVAQWQARQGWDARCTDEFGVPHVQTAETQTTQTTPPPQPTPTTPPPPQATEPTGPPPPPRVDPPGPRPTPNATWISGYWGWTGFEWSWAAGGYRIPDSDLRPPPAPPPPPRVEAPPPPPVRHGGYVSGRWVFTVSGWVWTPGRWRR